MGIYDNLIIPESISIDDFPFNASVRADGKYRWWQTKDLNPSMDMYGLIPSGKISEEYSNSKNDKVYLCRRHPPVTKWTNRNEGLIIDDYDDILEDADHWRQVRYTGTVNISELAEDACVYDVNIEVENSIVGDIEVTGRFDGVDSTFPKPPYSDILDLDSNPPSIIGTNKNLEDLSYYYYDKNDFETPKDWGLSSDEIALALNYYNTEYKSRDI